MTKEKLERELEKLTEGMSQIERALLIATVWRDIFGSATIDMDVDGKVVIATAKPDSP